MKRIFFIGCAGLALLFGCQSAYAAGIENAEEQAEETSIYEMENILETGDEVEAELESEMETESESNTKAESQYEIKSESETGVKEQAATEAAEESGDEGGNESENEIEKDGEVKNFVSRLYREILGREPDAEGLNCWTNYLSSGEKTGAEVADGFIYSNELRDRNLPDSDYVEMLYGSFLDRPSDNEGKETWINYLDKGMSRAYVYQGFANSTEFRDLCSEYGINSGEVILSVPRDQNADITMFVYRCYDKFLERKPDESGLNDWCGQLLNARINGKETARGFILSDEFQKKDVSNEDYVRTLYLGLFDRNADEEGLQCWVNLLNVGINKAKSREEVFRGFSDSNEFVSMCERYGIVPGKGGYYVDGQWTPEIHKMLTEYNYTTGIVSRIQYLVIHYVGALNDAIANCEFFAEGNKGRSAHYFVNYNGEIYQSIEDKNIAWHCGSSHYVHEECRNENSLSIEMCVRKKNTESLDANDADWYFEDETVDSVVHLTRYLMEKYNIPINHVIRHYDVSGKICPNPYVFNTSGHTWQEFLERLEK